MLISFLFHFSNFVNGFCLICSGTSFTSFKSVAVAGFLFDLNSYS